MDAEPVIEDASEREPLAREGEHVAPALEDDCFHCPHCGVLSQQSWSQLFPMGGDSVPYSRCSCRNCGELSIWNQTDGRMVDPLIGGGPRPHLEMSVEMKADYEEAQRVLYLSPRSACALLRLSIQKFCIEQGERGRSIDDDIKSLVSKGLAPEVKETLDVLRVVGNNAVHPGEMDLRDDVETATALFDLVNFVVEERVARPKRRKALLEKLPQGALDAIKRRDEKLGNQAQTPR